MDQWKSISGGGEDARRQLQTMRVMPREERRKLLSEAGMKSK